MIPELYREIVQKLARKTLAKEVNWKPSSDERTYLVNFSTFSLSINKVRPFRQTSIGALQQMDGIALGIISAQGKRIDSFTVAEDETEWDMISEMYAAARRTALGIEDAAKKIEKELDADGKIGGEGNPLDKEMPF